MKRIYLISPSVQIGQIILLYIFSLLVSILDYHAVYNIHRKKCGHKLISMGSQGGFASSNAVIGFVTALE